MNKAKLFLVAAAPAALIMPIDAFALEAEKVNISGSKVVNTELKAEISALPANTTITDYQWYYDEGNDSEGNAVHTPIEGAKNEKWTIPVDASNKLVNVLLKDSEGKEYVADPVMIQAINPKIEDGYSIEGATKVTDTNTTSLFALPGEQLSVKNLKVVDVVTAGGTPAEFTDNQVTYSYQWMYQVEKSDGGLVYSEIKGAMGNTMTVPKDALELQDPMNNIIVKISATVGGKKARDVHSQVILVANSPAEALVGGINGILIEGTNKNLIYGKTLAEIRQLEAGYQSLTTAAKANVTNYEKLQKAINDIEVVEKIEAQLAAYNQLVEGNEKREAKQALQSMFVALDLLQASLLSPGDLKDLLTLANSSSEIESDKIATIIDTELLKLLKDDTITSNINAGESIIVKVYDIPSDSEGTSLNTLLKKKIEALKKEIEKISKVNSSFVTNHPIYQEALKDIKAVEAFEKKLLKIIDTDEVTVIVDDKFVKKQISAAKAAKAAYDKLSYKQQSLVSQVQLDLIETGLTATVPVPEEPSDSPGNILHAAIEELVEDHAESAYEIAELEAKVESLLSQYKGMSKVEIKKVRNYDSLKAVQKDIKAASGAIKKLQALELALNPVAKPGEEPPTPTLSKVNSSYKSAYSAYEKLTTLQKGLIRNQHLLSDAAVFIANSIENPSDGAANVVSLINSIDYSGSLEDFGTTVSLANTAYKSLPDSKAKKDVTNYNKLTNALKDEKAVNTFAKKVQEALAELNVEKQYKLGLSVRQSYNKLTANQQMLVDANDTIGYVDLLAIVEETPGNLLETAVEVQEEIENLILQDGKGYSKDILGIRELETRYKQLSPTQKKQVTNYSVLKTALSDAKKAEAFMKKADSGFVKSPTKIFNDFNKLSYLQVSLVSVEWQTEIQKIVVEIDKNNELALEKIKSAETLVSDINNLVDSSGYVVSDNFAEKLTLLQQTYDGLTADTKKIVKNISILTKAQKDVEKVNSVYALEVAIDSDAARETWQTAFNKLNKQLENLYVKMYPIRM